MIDSDDPIDKAIMAACNVTHPQEIKPYGPTAGGVPLFRSPMERAFFDEACDVWERMIPKTIEELVYAIFNIPGPMRVKMDGAVKLISEYIDRMDDSEVPNK